MNLCFVLLSVCLGLAVPFNQDKERLSPEAAIAAVGKAEILVEFTVKASKDRLERRGCIFLDSEANFEDPKNLGIALSAKVAVHRTAPEETSDRSSNLELPLFCFPGRPPWSTATTWSSGMTSAPALMCTLGPQRPDQ